MTAQDANELLASAISNMQAGNDKAALNCALEAAAAGVQIRDLHFVLGILYSKLGESAKGLAALQHELQHFPDNIAAKELLASLSSPTPAIEAFGSILDPRLNEPANLLQVGEIAKAVSMLNELRASQPEIPFLHHLLGLAYAALNKPSYAHEMFWEEIGYFPTHYPAREGLRSLSCGKVLEDFQKTIDERNPHPSCSQPLSVISNGTISGGMYAEIRRADRHLRETPNLGLAQGIADLLMGNEPAAQAALLRNNPSARGSKFAQNILEQLNKKLLPVGDPKLWELIRAVVNRELADSTQTTGQKPYILLFPGIDVWRGSQVNDLGLEHFRPIYENLNSDPNVDVTFITIDGRHGLSGTGFKLGPLRVNRRPDAIVLMHPWWGEENALAFCARELGIPVIVSEHGAHFSDFSLIQTHGDIRESCYPADISCIWSELDYEIITQCYGCRDILFITGNPMHDELTRMKPPLPEGLEPGYTLILTAGQGVKRPAFWRIAEELSKLTQVVVKAHPLEPDIAGWQSRFPTFHRAEDLYPTVYHAGRVIAYVSNGLVPALYWEKPMWVITDDKPDPVYDDFKARNPGIFNFKKAEPITEKDLASEIRPKPDAYQRFAFLRDGMNASRVADVARLMTL